MLKEGPETELWAKDAIIFSNSHADPRQSLSGGSIKGGKLLWKRELRDAWRVSGEEAAAITAIRFLTPSRLFDRNGRRTAFKLTD